MFRLRYDHVVPGRRQSIFNACLVTGTASRNAPHISLCCLVFTSSILRVALRAASSWSICTNWGISRSSLPAAPSVLWREAHLEVLWYAPSGPCTVAVRLGILRYVVASTLTLGSLISKSTPGGIEMGIRPSFDCRCVEADSRRTGTDWKAGTRKDGSEVTEEESTALTKALPLLCASIVTLRKPLGGEAISIFTTQIQGVRVFVLSCSAAAISRSFTEPTTKLRRRAPPVRLPTHAALLVCTSTNLSIGFRESGNLTSSHYAEESSREIHPIHYLVSSHRRLLRNPDLAAITTYFTRPGLPSLPEEGLLLIPPLSCIQPLILFLISLGSAGPVS